MGYFTEYKFEGNDEILEIIMAELSVCNFDTFETRDNLLLSYVSEDNDDEKYVKELSEKYKISYTSKKIKKINWNKKWENSFNPIVVRDKCTIRADFHPKPSTPIDLIITPKMSFGTGHHSTTYLMLDYVLEEDLCSKTVCDMGSGTGILAILSDKLKAKKIDAVEIDTWSFENLKENIILNKSDNVIPVLGTIDKVIDNIYDIFLANINKNVLLNDLHKYSKTINKEGILLLSGFYDEDVNDIIKEANKYDFIYESKKEKNKWIALKFIKQ